MPKLTYAFQGNTLVSELGPKAVTVGRSSTNDVCIPDGGISRSHASFTPTPAGWEVRDLGSSNGTFVNGKRIQAQVLRHGDRVKLNQLEILFEDAVVPPPPPPPPKPKAVAPPPPPPPPEPEPELSNATRALSPAEVADLLRKVRQPEAESSTKRLDPSEVMETLKRLRAAAAGAGPAPAAPPQAPPVEEGPGATKAISADELKEAWKALKAAPPPVPAPAPAPAPAAAPKTTEEMLARVALFAGVAPPMLKLIGEESQFHVFGPRAVICREGEYTADFYVLLSGLIGVYKAEATMGGKNLHLASLPPGSFFGEMSCMSHAPRSATVICESDVVAVSIPRHTFLKVYADKKSASFKDIIDKSYRERALRNHLASLAIFRGLDPKILARVGEKAELLIAEKGTVIAGDAKPADGVYLVRTGHAKLVSRPGPGEETLGWFCENAFFGVKTVVDDVPAGTSMIAVDRMDLVRVPHAALDVLVKEFPALLQSILDNSASAGRAAEAGEVLTADEAEARRRAREIGGKGEVIKAGDALVIDMSKCTRCNMCVEGCVEAHDDRIPRIGKRGMQYGDLLLTSSCYNCKVPDCMLACKFGAIRRDRKGQVQIDSDACTGCALCEPACPYGTIHMQSLVGGDGISTKASAGPVKDLLRSLPLVGKLLWKGKEIPVKTGEAVPAAPAAAAPAEKGERKKLRQAVKCDLCAGRSDMACIASCPCGAIERIDPTHLLSG
jgi:CRP-like cAMP-binding protein/Fe-S-cluster-containing hydrogenase component 2/pSer/pThr/pTyr-binding forkhead associated (FHA) protein